MAIVRLKGRVRGPASGAIVLRRAELVAEGGERETSGDGDAFEVELEDGARVRVTLDAEAPVVPPRVTRGRWGDLESSEDALPFRRRAPAPHVQVQRLASASVRDGDLVELVGVPTEEADTSEGGGYRSASGKRVVAVRASHVAVGANATKELDRALATPRGARRSLVKLVLEGLLIAIVWPIMMVVEHFKAIAVVASIAGVGASFFVSPAFAIYLCSFCLGALGFVAFFAHKRKEPPHFTTGSAHAASFFFWWGIFFPPVYVALPAIVFLWLLIDPLVNAVSSRRTARRMRVLATTPRFPPELPDGAWGSAVGTVVDRAKSFFVDTDVGRIEVMEERAPWSTPPMGEGRGVIAVGSRVLLVGRIERAEKAVWVRYSGPDSLMYFATPSDVDPEREVRTYLARRRSTYAIMIALAVAVLATSLWFLVHLPPSK